MFPGLNGGYWDAVGVRGAVRDKIKRQESIEKEKCDQLGPSKEMLESAELVESIFPAEENIKESPDSKRINRSNSIEKQVKETVKSAKSEDLGDEPALQSLDHTKNKLQEQTEKEQIDKVDLTELRKNTIVPGKRLEVRINQKKITKSGLPDFVNFIPSLPEENYPRTFKESSKKPQVSNEKELNKIVESPEFEEQRKSQDSKDSRGLYIEQNVKSHAIIKSILNDILENLKTEGKIQFKGKPSKRMWQVEDSPSKKMKVSSDPLEKCRSSDLTVSGESAVRPALSKVCWTNKIDETDIEKTAIQHRLTRRRSSENNKSKINNNKSFEERNDKNNGIEENVYDFEIEEVSRTSEKEETRSTSLTEKICNVSFKTATKTTFKQKRSPVMKEKFITEEIAKDDLDVLIKDDLDISNTEDIDWSLGCDLRDEITETGDDNFDIWASTNAIMKSISETLSGVSSAKSDLDTVSLALPYQEEIITSHPSKQRNKKAVENLCNPDSGKENSEADANVKLDGKKSDSVQSSFVSKRKRIANKKYISDEFDGSLSPSRHKKDLSHPVGQTKRKRSASTSTDEGSENDGKRSIKEKHKTISKTIKLIEPSPTDPEAQIEKPKSKYQKSKEFSHQQQRKRGSSFDYKNKDESDSVIKNISSKSNSSSSKKPSTKLINFLDREYEKARIDGRGSSSSNKYKK